MPIMHQMPDTAELYELQQQCQSSQRINAVKCCATQRVSVVPMASLFADELNFVDESLVAVNESKSCEKETQTE